MESVGQKIRIHRLSKNYSQEYMSFMLEISQGAYSNIESDKTELTLKRLYEIAEILEVSPFQLLPPPKSGSGINFGKFLKTIFRLRTQISKRIIGKHAEALQLGIVYRDKSKV